MSKELDALEFIKEKFAYLEYNCENFNSPKEELFSVEQYILNSQKEKKILKILFKKQVDINEIRILISNLKHCDDIEKCHRYNLSRKFGYKLKQEEFDFIKDMLFNYV